MTITLVFNAFCFDRAFQTGLSTFLFFFGKDLSNFSFSVYPLWEYLVVPKKDREFCFCWSFLFTPWRWMAVAWLVLQGKLHGIRVGVLPSVSFFLFGFSAIFALCISSLFIAAPRRKSISLDVEILNLAATSLMVFGL